MMSKSNATEYPTDPMLDEGWIKAITNKLTNEGYKVVKFEKEG